MSALIRRILVPVAKIAAFYAIWAVIFSAAVMAIVTGAGPKWFEHLEWRIALEAAGAFGIFLALLVMTLGVDRLGTASLGLPLRAAPFHVIAGTIFGAFLFCLPLFLLWLTGRLTIAPNFAALSWSIAGPALLLVFVNTIDQELLVRSYLFQTVWRKAGPATAVAVSTLVFGALHAAVLTKGAPGLLAMLNVLAASVMLGIAYLRSGNLWLPIGIHFGWNGFQGVILGLHTTGAAFGTTWQLVSVKGGDLWTGGDMGIEGSIAGLVGPLVGIAVLHIVLPQTTKSPSPVAA